MVEKFTGLFFICKKIKKKIFMIKIFALAIQLFLPNQRLETLRGDPSVFSEFSAKNAENLKPYDISGHWEGTITRDEGGGKRTVFKMELDLTQKGKDITGVSYVHADGEKRTYSANMGLIGRINKNYFKYLETKILNYDAIPDAEWCVKKCELSYKFVKGTTPTL
jgi:hypothetical protein